MNVEFVVPAYIEAGLASGAFERVGGVIRDSQSKAVVSWLREGLPLPEASSLPIWGSAAQAVSMLSAGGMLLNLGISTASLVVITQRLDKLTNSIDRLEETVRSEFKRDRDTRFKGALQSARDALEASNKRTRSNQAHVAINGLYESQINFLEDFDKSLEANPLLAQHSLVRAMYATNSRIRCYLEMGETDLAKTRLNEDMHELKPRFNRLIESWMGKHPAKFLHPSVNAVDADRFINVQFFLNGFEERTTQNLMTIIHELRPDFWNDEVMEGTNRDIISRIRRVEPSFEDQVKTFPEKLLHAETLIENFQRLQSFEMELRYLKLSNTSFEAWNNKVNLHKVEEKKANIVLLIPDQPIPLDTVA